MIVPILNPLRFYAPNASRVKENNPFFLSQNYWNELNGSYQPKFLDKLQCIAYEDSLGGVYGFSDVSEFIGTPTNPRIENCKFCFDGGNAIYTNLDGATIGKVLIVKYSGTIDIEVRENTTVIHSYTGLTDGLFIHELTQNYVNLTINIEVSDPTCILGAMVVEPFITYDTCNDTIRAYPIDICSHGGVYLINLQSNYFRQTLDFLPIAVAFGSGLVDIEITYSNGTIITGNYDNSISFQDKIDATLNLLTAFEKIITTPTVIIRDNLITTIEFIQGVTRVVISPTGVQQFNTDCCNISIGDYESEFFTIINQQDKEFLKLQKVSYLSYFMDKDMAFSDLWEAHILVESKLIYTKGSDKEIFEGQNKNTILDDKALRLRIFRSGAIPYYLAEQLDLIFGFNLNIDGVNYVAHEQTEIEEITSNTDLFNFECILRAQDFDLDAANSLYSQAIIAFKNATLRVNGGVIKSLSSGEVWNLKVEVDGVESGTFDGIDTWEIEGGGGLCDDASYTLKDTDDNILSSGTIPSGGTDDIIAPDASYLVEYANGTDIEIGSILSGGSATIVVPNPPTMMGAMPTQTGQTSSYALFDDGAVQFGRLVDFLTLPYNNGFGNTNRFTDTLGGQNFATNGNIVIDWSTWAFDSVEVIGYCYNIYSNFTGTRNRTDWGLNAPYTCSGFGSFYLINENMRNSISNLSLSSGFNGVPFNIPVSGFTNRFYTSSTISNGNSIVQSHGDPLSSQISPTSTLRAMLYRVFTWNGTTLT